MEIKKISRSSELQIQIRLRLICILTVVLERTQFLWWVAKHFIFSYKFSTFFSENSDDFHKLTRTFES